MGVVVVECWGVTYNFVLFISIFFTLGRRRSPSAPRVLPLVTASGRPAVCLSVCPGKRYRSNSLRFQLSA